MNFRTLAAILVLHALSFGSALSDAAASMNAGSWKKLGTHGLSIPDVFLSWSNSGVWDPINRKALHVGSAGTCCSDGQYSIIIYDEASNRWSVQNAPIKASGHAYDGNTIDPATGKLYFSVHASSTIHTYSNGSWGAIPGAPYSGAAPAAAWFPEVNGLVYVGGDGNHALYNGTKWSALPKASTPWGGYHVFAEYNPTHQVVWLGGGNDGTSISYKLDASLKLTRLADAPTSLRTTSSMESVDPVSGNYLVVSFDSNKWWAFDVAANKWISLTMPGAPTTLFSGKAFHVPIATHGVILFFLESEVYLYKHAIGTVGVNTGEVPVRTEGLRATPNLFVSTVRFPGAGTLSVFDVSGRLVHRGVPTREASGARVTVLKSH